MLASAYIPAAAGVSGPAFHHLHTLPRYLPRPGSVLIEDIPEPITPSYASIGIPEDGALLYHISETLAPATAQSSRPATPTPQPSHTTTPSPPPSDQHVHEGKRSFRDSPSVSISNDFFRTPTPSSPLLRKSASRLPPPPGADCDPAPTGKPAVWVFEKSHAMGMLVWVLLHEVLGVLRGWSATELTVKALRLWLWSFVIGLAITLRALGLARRVVVRVVGA